MLWPALTWRGQEYAQHVQGTCPWAINFVGKQNKGQFCAPGYSTHLYHAGSRLLSCDGAAD